MGGGAVGPQCEPGVCGMHKGSFIIQVVGCIRWIIHYTMSEGCIHYSVSYGWATYCMGSAVAVSAGYVLGSLIIQHQRSTYGGYSLFIVSKIHMRLFPNGVSGLTHTVINYCTEEYQGNVFIVTDIILRITCISMYSKALRG